MKVTEQYFPVVLFIIPYSVALTSKRNKVVMYVHSY